MINDRDLKKITTAVEGRLEQGIQGVGTDTRQDLTDQLFVPLIGEHFNGHDFIEAAMTKGATAVFWQKDQPFPKTLTVKPVIYYVNDTLEALQQLAKVHRDKINPTVIGITGSNGKTSTKDLVASVLKTKFQTHVTKGNFNNHIGLPLTILNMPATTEVVVLEMGMSAKGEIEALSHLARPDIAVITNIGESHIEFLKTRTGISEAKLEILTGLSASGLFVYDGDEPLLRQSYPVKTMSVGFYAHNDYQIETVTVTDTGTSFHLNQLTQFQIPLVGKHHAKNASYAVAIARYLGVTDAQIQTGLDNMIQTGMRFEVVMRGEHQVINDAYNASPTSMRGLIDIVSELTTTKQKVLILGDMYELGEKTADYHREVGAYITEKIDVLLTLGEAARHIKANCQIKQHHFETTTALVDYLNHLNQPSLLAFKASRGMRLEKVIDQLNK